MGILNIFKNKQDTRKYFIEILSQADSERNIYYFNQALHQHLTIKTLNINMRL